MSWNEKRNRRGEGRNRKGRKGELREYEEGRKEEMGRDTGKEGGGGKQGER